MDKKYETCIVSNQQTVSSLPSHAAGDYRIWMSEELVPGADFYIIGGTRERIEHHDPIRKYPRNDVGEVYLFIGEKEAVQVEVELDDEKYLLESPGAVYIPNRSSCP